MARPRDGRRRRLRPGRPDRARTPPSCAPRSRFLTPRPGEAEYGPCAPARKPPPGHPPPLRTASGGSPHAGDPVCGAYPRPPDAHHPHWPPGWPKSLPWPRQPRPPRPSPAHDPHNLHAHLAALVIVRAHRSPPSSARGHARSHGSTGFRSRSQAAPRRGSQRVRPLRPAQGWGVSGFPRSRGTGQALYLRARQPAARPPRRTTEPRRTAARIRISPLAASC